MEEKRIPIGIKVHNGILQLKDIIRCDDRWLCFETVVVSERGVVGSYYSDDYLCLLDFLRDLTVF